MLGNIIPGLEHSSKMNVRVSSSEKSGRRYKAICKRQMNKS
jgi:hypothetical protein